jgi:mannobiose 2-epimerase
MTPKMLWPDAGPLASGVGTARPQSAQNPAVRIGDETASHLAGAIEAHLFEHILPFWCGPALDHEQGGWMAWLSNDLKPDRAQPKGLIVNSRILWAFSAAHQARPEPLFQKMADRAFDIVSNRFWDRQYGGALWRLDDRGNVLDDSKKLYGQAFYLYALVEYYQAFRNTQALERARELFELMERHGHDNAGGGYWEVLRRDWSEAPNARLSERDMAEKKSMNNHLHVLEAYTNLYRVSRAEPVERRLRELLSLFERRILDTRTWHLNHFFNEAWEVRSDTCTYGHDIEASWLLCEATEVLGDSALLRRQKEIAVAMAKTVLDEGMSPQGGLCYEGKGGKIIDPGRECWPQAEALVGFLNAYQISHQPEFFTAASGIWTFINTHLVDRVHGEWFWRITPEGAVDPSLPKVSEWKGPYHGTRACLEAARRLKSLI